MLLNLERLTNTYIKNQRGCVTDLRDVILRVLVLDVHVHARFAFQEGKEIRPH